MAQAATAQLCRAVQETADWPASLPVNPTGRVLVSPRTGTPRSVPGNADQQAQGGQHTNQA